MLKEFSIVSLSLSLSLCNGGGEGENEETLWVLGEIAGVFIDKLIMNGKHALPPESKACGLTSR